MGIIQRTKDHNTVLLSVFDGKIMYLTCKSCTIMSILSFPVSWGSLKSSGWNKASPSGQNVRWLHITSLNNPVKLIIVVVTLLLLLLYYYCCYYYYCCCYLIWETKFKPRKDLMTQKEKRTNFFDIGIILSIYRWLNGGPERFITFLQTIHLVRHRGWHWNPRPFYLEIHFLNP